MEYTKFPVKIVTDPLITLHVNKISEKKKVSSLEKHSHNEELSIEDLIDMCCQWDHGIIWT